MTWQTGVLNLGDDENGSLSQKVAEGVRNAQPNRRLRTPSRAAQRCQTRGGRLASLP